MTIRTLVSRYVAFAVLATLANLATQRLVLLLGDNIALYMTAVATGTLVGLVFKFFLDKRWIFHDPSQGFMSHGRKFTLYAAMGLFTTAIFWGTETLFWLTWQTDVMREIGAILGLAIGYIVKYDLDRRFVFTDASLLREKAA